MNMVGRVGSLLTQGVYSIATPFQPFGGAVDIIVVKQPDGTYRSTPWYVRFGKFQGILKRSEKIVRISVNGFEANFNMFLDNSGEAYFLREVFPGNEEIDFGKFSRADVDNVNSDGRKGEADDRKNEQEHEETKYSEFIDEFENMVMSSEEPNMDMLHMSVDGHVITAPISKDDEEIDDAQLNIPQFHLGPTEGTNEDFETDMDVWSNSLYSKEKDGVTNEDQKLDNECQKSTGDMNKGMPKDRDMFKSCLELTEACASTNGSVEGEEAKLTEACASTNGSVEGEEATSTNVIIENINQTTRSDIPLDSVGQAVDIDTNDCGNILNENNVHDPSINGDVHDNLISDETELNVMPSGSSTVKIECIEEQPTIPSMQIFSGFGFEISKCSQLFSPGMGSTAAKEIFEAHQIFEDEFKAFGSEIVKNANLIVRYKNEYFLWEKVAHIIIGKALFGSNFLVEPGDSIPTEHIDTSNISAPSTSSTKWRLWPIPFRRDVKSFQRSNSSLSNDEFFDSESFFEEETLPGSSKNSPRKIFQRTNMPTTEQIASLNLKEGQNTITFNFTTRVLGKQQVDAHIYLWKWNAKIVVSDVDGTITRSDVLGQFMPLVGRDWSQSGVAKLFTAIKENGYQLLFLSARAIVQAYLTKSFLSNLKQDGNALPTGPVVISPDGLLPALYREVIRRAPHEFKIACLQDIRDLFPSDYNPFYAGFGNRDTDELSYAKVGIPKGKIFIINPKGEVALNNCGNKKSYTSLHDLVDDMFPPTSIDEQEAYNSWNYWKIPLPNID